MRSAIFAVVMLVPVLLFARRVGWSLSRVVLYPASPIVAYLVSIGWGVFVGLVVYGLARALEPNAVVKWLCGYFAGAYAADPAYGLVAESTIPADGWRRHALIQVVPIVSFVVTLVGMTFWF